MARLLRTRCPALLIGGNSTVDWSAWTWQSKALDDLTLALDFFGVPLPSHGLKDMSSIVRFLHHQSSSELAALETTVE